MPIDQPPAMQNWAYSGPTLQMLHHHGQLALVTLDGEVSINWKHVEETAADPSSEQQALFYARLLLAARDGTAKPLSDDTHQTEK
jgi:hypothetical protein